MTEEAGEIMTILIVVIFTFIITFAWLKLKKKKS